MAETLQLNVLRSSLGDEETGGPLFLALTVLDPDVVSALAAYPEGPSRDEMALAALRIGVIALRQARGQIDADAVRRESQRLLSDMQSQLQQHSQAVQQQLAGTLKDYFDPENGRFHERVQRLVRKDGELEALLQRQIGGSDSELCKTLAQHFGNDSPLMQVLTPDQSRGLLAALRGLLENQLTEQRKHVLAQFSLDNKDGALARLVSELTENQGELTKLLGDKIDDVVKEFSLDVEDSALSRLVRNVDRAQRTISAEFSLDNEGSALARLKQLLESTQQAIHGNLTLDEEGSSLARLKRELMSILESHGKLNATFQEEVKVTLARLTARKEEQARGTRHGVQFEQAVGTFLQDAAAQRGDVLHPVGERVGQIKNCKVGDFVLELGPDSAAPGAKIVIEAKEDQSYDVPAARAECDRARKNRDAQLALFVFSKRTAPEMSEPFANYGDDVLVVWDAEDAASDLYLKLALGVTRALCIRRDRQRSQQAADFQEIDRAVLEIEKRAGNLEQVEKWADTIRARAEDILKHVSTSRGSLTRQVETLQERLDDVRQDGSK